MRLLTYFLMLTALVHARPRTWIISDLSPEWQDKDDQVTLAAYLLMIDKFDNQGIVVGSTNKEKATCEEAGTYVTQKFGQAYAAENENLRQLPNFPEQVEFTQSSVCHISFDKNKSYNAGDYPSIQAMLDAAKHDTLYVLGWGRLTELAIAVKYLLDQNDQSTLNNLITISHWTTPTPYNCGGDQEACDYIHVLAKQGTLAFYELGPMGQDGLVENNCNSNTDLSKSTLMKSEIGAIMDEKWNGDGMPDMSDGATFLVLAGYGGGLDPLKPDGSYDNGGLTRLCNDRDAILPLLEDRAEIAAGKTVNVERKLKEPRNKNSAGNHNQYRSDGKQLYKDPVNPFRIFYIRE